MRRYVIAFFLVFVSALGSAFADDPADEGENSIIVDKMRNYENKHSSADEKLAKKTEQSILPDAWCANIDDQETRLICWKAYRASFNYHETGLTHRRSVFRWQHFSTRVIFFVVIALVASGVYFAWVQFRQSREMGGASTTSEQNEIELSTSGIKVKSSVLGVIVLTLSMGFFYLYLRYVFPITEIF